MKKYVTTLDEARGLVQITVADERWYARVVPSPETALPKVVYVPSVTWICSYYPKGVGYHKWLAALGWNEAEAVRQAAAEKGSQVHQACAALLDGQTITMESAFQAPDMELPAPLTVEGYEAVLAFADWWATLKNPTVLAKDFVVWGDGYAGTLDLLMSWEGEDAGIHLIDLKTSQEVWPEHQLQV